MATGAADKFVVALDVCRPSNSRSPDHTGRIPLGRARSQSPVARLTLLFGRLGGVLMSKVIVVIIALGVKRLLWVVNLFYAGVVCWNILVLIILSRS
jgi:hypothetical protein